MNNETVISQEFFKPGNFLENIPKFTEELLTYFKTKDYVERELTKIPSYRHVKIRLEKVSYASMRETYVYVPAGLSVTYVDYLNVLRTSVEISNKLLPEILIPFSRWLSDMINNTSKFSTISNSSTIRDFKPHDVSGNLYEIGKCFEKGVNENKVQFKNVFNSNGEVKTVMEGTEQLVADFIKISRKDVKARIEDIAANLDVLIKRVQEEDSDYKITDKVVDFISQLSYTLAREVEFYGTVAFHLTQVTTSLNDTVKVIK